MNDSEVAVDVAAVRFDAAFPDLRTFPGEMGAIATLLSPDGVRLAVRLPGGEVRAERLSGQDLVLTYAHLAAGKGTPWPLADGMVETDGEQVAAPGDPPLVGALDDFRRTLGSLVADLFAAIESAGLDPVHTVRQYLGPRAGLDVEDVHEGICGA
jgi:hypothetical protein